MAFAKGLMAAALLAAGFFQSVRAQSDGPEFIYPAKKDDGKLAFFDNAEVVVSYKCPTDSIVLRIYCNDEDKEGYVHQGLSQLKLTYAFEANTTRSRCILRHPMRR